MKPKTTKKKKR